MELVVIVLVALIVASIVAARVRAGPPPKKGSPPIRHMSPSMEASERAYAAQIEVEESDIAEMLEARNALRRRRGAKTIGDELVEEALGEEREE